MQTTSKRPAGFNRNSPRTTSGLPLAGRAGGLWSAQDPVQPLEPLEQERLVQTNKAKTGKPEQEYPGNHDRFDLIQGAPDSYWFELSCRRVGMPHRQGKWRMEHQVARFMLRGRTHHRHTV